MEFIETPTFTELIGKIGFEDEYLDLQLALAQNPCLGTLIPGGGGLRKARWRSARRQKGKRGGLRIIYYIVREDRLYMIFAYDKDKQGDLTGGQLKTLRSLVKRGAL